MLEAKVPDVSHYRPVSTVAACAGTAGVQERDRELDHATLSVLAHPTNPRSRRLTLA
jgi:hypothetical protein